MSINKKTIKIIFQKGLFYLILAIFIYPFGASAANILSLNPSSSTISPGQSFSLNLLIDSTTNLFGVGFDLLFDPALIQFVNASHSGSLLDQNASSTPSLNTGVNPAGDLIFSLVRYNPDIGVSTTSTSTIATLNFQALTGIGSTSSSTTLLFPSGFASLCFVATSGASCTIQGGVWQNGSVTVQDLTPPTTPGSFTASATSLSTINLNWASSTDTNGISKYYIYRTSTTTPIASTTGLIYGDSGLSAGTSYNYFVKAVDTAGNSSGLATTSGTTLVDNIPPSITIITPTVNPTYNASTSPINLSGTATDNLAVSLVTWVNSLTIATGTASSTVASTTNWSITGLNLQAGSNTLSVVARDAENNRATATLIVILDSSLPVVSTSTSATASAASASQINLSWPAASDTGGSGLAGYRIYRNSTSTAPIATVASTTTSYSDTGLSASTAYTYYIFAYDNAGNQSANYATSSATTSAAPVTPPSGGGGGTIIPPDTTPPARPSNFKASPADGRITLSWVNPVDSDFGGVLILRTEASTTPVCPTAYNDQKAKQVYKGKAIESVDIGLNNNLKYCYAIFSFDNIPNYTTPSVLTVQPGAGQSTTVATSTTETTIVDNQTGTAGAGTSLADAPGSVVDVVSLDEAHQTFDRNQFVAMTAVTVGIYNKIMAQAGAGYNDQEKRALANFIQNGTANTRILGAGERGGSVGSFIAAFGRLPRSIADWQDVVKIGNGRWPKQTNSKAEAAAEVVFKKIYLHTPKRTINKYEDNAIRIIAYGLRPAKRNMNSEAAAIKSFKYIFKRAPSKSNDWDIIRAIAYSGAKR